MPKRNGSTRSEVGLGALAGLAGTVVIQIMKMGSEKWLPSVAPPVEQDPGEFMVEKVEERLPKHTVNKIPHRLEVLAAQSLAFGYGMTFGGLYGVAHPQRQRTFIEGSILGSLAWGAGYLGWLPAMKLMPPVHRQKARQVVPNLLAHILYGIATVAAFRSMERKLSRS